MGEGNLIRDAWSSAGDAMIPEAVVSPGPGGGDFAADDGSEAAAHHRGAHVDVDDEGADGDQRGGDVEQDGGAAEAGIFAAEIWRISLALNLASASQSLRGSLAALE